VSSVRAVTLPRKRLSDASPLSNLKVESVLVVYGSAGASRSPRDLELRVQTGALLVAVHREQELLPHPSPREPLHVGDVAYLIGTSESVRAAARLLGEPVVPPAPHLP